MRAQSPRQDQFAPIIGVLYDAHSAYALNVVKGVASYANQNGYRIVTVDGTRLGRGRSAFSRMDVAGLIADLNQPHARAVATAFGRPGVGFGVPPDRNTGMPFFCTDNSEIAAWAADHLIASGVQSFAFCGYVASAATDWWRQREQAFVAHVGARGFRAHVLRLRSLPGRVPQSVTDVLAAWLQRLPKPVGIMATHDALGRQLLEACRILQLGVPDDVSVIGVDNDDFECQVSYPALSSIEHNAVRLGHAAAMLLGQMVDGRSPRDLEHVIAPRALVSRQSSSRLTVSDPEVSAALQVIDNRLSTGIRVRDVVAASRFSRRELERRFEAALRRSIAAAIRDLRLRRARDLVSNPALPLKQAATLAGFRSVQHLTTAFARVYGRTPGEYRRRVILGGSPADL
jgi:LacI family transcriptional regulator